MYKNFKKYILLLAIGLNYGGEQSILAMGEGEEEQHQIIPTDGEGEKQKREEIQAKETALDRLRKHVEQYTTAKQEPNRPLVESDTSSSTFKVNNGTYDVRSVEENAQRIADDRQEAQKASQLAERQKVEQRNAAVGSESLNDVSTMTPTQLIDELNRYTSLMPGNKAKIQDIIDNVIYSKNFTSEQAEAILNWHKGQSFFIERLTDDQIYTVLKKISPEYFKTITPDTLMHIIKIGYKKIGTLLSLSKDQVEAINPESLAKVIQDKQLGIQAYKVNYFMYQYAERLTPEQAKVIVEKDVRLKKIGFVSLGLDNYVWKEIESKAQGLPENQDEAKNSKQNVTSNRSFDEKTPTQLIDELNRYTSLMPGNKAKIQDIIDNVIYSENFTSEQAEAILNWHKGQSFFIERLTDDQIYTVLKKISPEYFKTITPETLTHIFDITSKDSDYTRTVGESILSLSPEQISNINPDSLAKVIDSKKTILGGEKYRKINAFIEKILPDITTEQAQVILAKDTSLGYLDKKYMLKLKFKAETPEQIVNDLQSLTEDSLNEQLKKILLEKLLTPEQADAILNNIELINKITKVNSDAKILLENIQNSTSKA